MKKILELPGALDAATVLYLCLFLSSSSRFVLFTSAMCVAAIRAAGIYIFANKTPLIAANKAALDTFLFILLMAYLFAAPASYESYILTVASSYISFSLIFEGISIFVRIRKDRSIIGS